VVQARTFHSGPHAIQQLAGPEVATRVIPGGVSVNVIAIAGGREIQEIGQYVLGHGKLAHANPDAQQGHPGLIANGFGAGL
jgi:hypothetical protein